MDDAMIDPSVAEVIEPDERVERVIRLADTTVLVTDRRIAVRDAVRVALDVSYDGLRRIQFDVERHRPATLVMVPERPTDEAQVITVEADRIEDVAQAVGLVGVRLASLDRPSAR